MAQFNAYRDAFAKARSAGEDVTIEAARIREEIATLERKGAATPVASSSRAGSLPTAASGSDSVNDQIELRLKCWMAIASYNDLLAGFLEGKSPAQLSAAASTFTKVKNTVAPDLFQKQITTLATSIGPWGGVLAQAVALLEQEAANRAFIEAVRDGGPVVQAMLRLLRDDADSYYLYALSRNDLDYEPALDQVSETLKPLDRVWQTGTADRKLRERLVALRAGRAALRDADSSVHTLPVADIPSAGAQGSPVRLADVEDEVVAAEEALEAARRCDETLHSFGSLLEAYADLVTQTEEAMRRLLSAIATGEGTLTDTDALLRAYVKMKQAIEAAREARRSSHAA